MSYKRILDADDCTDPNNNTLAIDCAKYAITYYNRPRSLIEKCETTCRQTAKKKKDWRAMICLSTDKRCHYEKYVLAKLDSLWDEFKEEEEEQKSPKKFYYYEFHFLQA